MTAIVVTLFAFGGACALFLAGYALRGLPMALKEDIVLHERDRRGFHLVVEFSSLEEFGAFCAILRGQEVGDDVMKMLSAKLSASITPLVAAEKAAG